MMNNPDYFLNLSSPAFADQIMNMADGSTAEIIGDGLTFIRKTTPFSYVLGKKSGMIDLELTSYSAISDIEEIFHAILTLVDENQAHRISLPSRDATQVFHFYFYPKEEKDGKHNI